MVEEVPKNQLKNKIDQDENCQLKELKVSNETFSNETILDEFLQFCSFTKVNFLDLNFTNGEFDLSFFKDCSFVNCSFDTMSFCETRFRNCNFNNCSLKNCNFISAHFDEVKFDNCSFEKGERGNLIEAWFHQSHFIETKFNGFDPASLVRTGVENSTFSKFNKTIQLTGTFALIDILQSKTGLEGIFQILTDLP